MIEYKVTDEILKPPTPEQEKAIQVLNEFEDAAMINFWDKQVLNFIRNYPSQIIIGRRIK